MLRSAFLAYGVHLLCTLCLLPAPDSPRHDSNPDDSAICQLCAKLSGEASYELGMGSKLAEGGDSVFVC